MNRGIASIQMFANQMIAEQTSIVNRLNINMHRVMQAKLGFNPNKINTSEALLSVNP